MFLITNSAGCSCCLCFPTTGYKMDNGEEHELQCLNPDLLSQAAENPPLPGLFSAYRSSNLPCTQLRGRCVTILFNSAQGPDANRSSSAHTQLRLEDEDVVLYPAFRSAEAFCPKLGFSLQADPTLAEQNKSYHCLLLGTFAPGPTVLNSELLQENSIQPPLLDSGIFSPFQKIQSFPTRNWMRQH